MMEISKELQKRINSVNKQWAKDHKVGEEVAPRLRLGSDLGDPIIVSTGNPSLDQALGGGIPEGTIFEIYGVNASGKTTTMAYMMRKVQDNGKLVVYYHTEESNKPTASWNLAGVDDSMVIYLDSRYHGEDGNNAVREILLNDKGLPDPAIGMFVIDSFAALAPSAEMDSIEDKGAEGFTMGAHAKMSAKLFRGICGGGWLSEGCLVGIINQEKEQIGNTHLPAITAGGKAITYFPKIRIQLRTGAKDDLIKDGDNVIGNTIRFEVKKNNTGIAPPYKTGSWRFIYGKGLDLVGPVIDSCLEFGLISVVGRTYSIKWLNSDNVVEEEKIIGRAILQSRFMGDPKIVKTMSDMIERVRDVASREYIEFIDGQAMQGIKNVNIFELLKAQGEASDRVLDT